MGVFLVFCSQCGCENSDYDKFCRNCGCALNIHSNMRNMNRRSQTNNDSSSSKNLLIIGITLIIIVLIVMGTFLLISDNHEDTSIQDKSSDNNVSNNTNSAQDNSADAKQLVTQQTSPLRIISGSFTTGSSLSDKTYITVYVGEEHAGESVKIKVLYTRDGSQLNAGNVVPLTVDSSGRFTMNTANSFKYYPDHAFITLYDGNGNIVDTLDVDMEPTSGTQTF